MTNQTLPDKPVLGEFRRGMEPSVPEQDPNPNQDAIRPYGLREFRSAILVEWEASFSATIYRLRFRLNILKARSFR
jgi:hypothetical protein